MKNTLLRLSVFHRLDKLWNHSRDEWKTLSAWVFFIDSIDLKCCSFDSIDLKCCSFDSLHFCHARLSLPSVTRSLSHTSTHSLSFSLSNTRSRLLSFAHKRTLMWCGHKCSATHCNRHCNTLQHTATHCITLHHTASHCSTLQHTAAHCNTLRHYLDANTRAKTHNQQNHKRATFLHSCFATCCTYKWVMSHAGSADDATTARRHVTCDRQRREKYQFDWQDQICCAS